MKKIEIPREVSPAVTRLQFTNEEVIEALVDFSNKLGEKLETYHPRAVRFPNREDRDSLTTLCLEHLE